MRRTRRMRPRRMAELEKLIHGWDKLRFLNRYNALTMLEQIARDNYDAENLLKYCEQELAIRRAEMSDLEKVSAPKDEMNEKTAQVATSLERVAAAEADLASFEKAETHGLEALRLRQSLPEEMPDRKLDESLGSVLEGSRHQSLGGSRMNRPRILDR